MIVVDASLVAALFLGETSAPAAERLLFARRDALQAPDLLPLEVASALTRAARGGRLPPPDAAAAVDRLPALPITLRSHGPLLRRAVAISLEIRHAVQDCLYLALAEANRDRLATFDRRLAALAVQLGIPLWTPDPAA